jgi:uncharacterized membrane protein
VPALGIVLSAAFFGERIDAPLVAGVLLIGAGIRMAARTAEVASAARPSRE